MILKARTAKLGPNKQRNILVIPGNHKKRSDNNSEISIQQGNRKSEHECCKTQNTGQLMR